MDLSLNEDQTLLAESVARFVRNEYEFETRRALVASDPGFGAGNWAKFAELGWLAIPFSEADGGLGADPVAAMVLMEQFGRGLVVEPYVPGVLLGGGLVAAAGDAVQRSRLLGGVIAGDTHLAFAHGEPGGRYTPSHVAARAEARGGGYTLTGAKSVVYNAAAADHIVVSARTAGETTDEAGISLFLVPRGADGLTLRPYRTIDGLRAAEVALDGVSVGDDALLGAEGGAFPVIEAVTDRAVAAVCAEALGVMDVLRETTLEYLKTRKQFGRPLGSFQALQHRAVDMLIACEEARSLVLMATLGLDAPAPERRRAVSAAKAHIGRAGRKVGQEAVQMHGGMGVTDELKVGHYFKRLTMIDTFFGDAAHHLDRFADNSADDRPDRPLNPKEIPT